MRQDIEWMVPHHKLRGWIHYSALQGKRIKGQETIETAKVSADVGKNETHRSAPHGQMGGMFSQAWLQRRFLEGPVTLEEKLLRKGGRREGKCGTTSSIQRKESFSKKSLLITTSWFLQIQMKQNILLRKKCVCLFNNTLLFILWFITYTYSCMHAKSF